MASRLKPNKGIFLTNYALVVLAIGHDNEIRMCDIANRIGITERAVQRIIDELTDAGFLIPTRSGRRNTYQMNSAKDLGLPFSDCRLSELLKLCKP